MSDPREVPNPGSSPDRTAAQDVARRLRALVAQSQLYADGVGHDLGLHRSDLMAMNLMSQAAVRGELMTPGEVAKQMSLSAAAVTALVDRLERVGHLVRHADTRDRRRVRLDISNQAETVSRRMFRPMNERMYAAMSPYTDAELALVARVMADLTEAVRREEPEDAAAARAPGSTLSDHATG